jgi:hypothetical protein
VLSICKNSYILVDWGDGWSQSFVDFETWPLLACVPFVPAMMMNENGWNGGDVVQMSRGAEPLGICCFCDAGGTSCGTATRVPETALHFCGAFNRKLWTPQTCPTSQRNVTSYRRLWIMIALSDYNLTIR